MRSIFYRHLILIALLAALGGALVYFGDPARVQQQILAELEKGSGYRVTAGGMPSLVYTPNVALELNDVMFHEPSRHDTDPVLRAAKVKAVAGWIPLFTQWRVDLKRVEVSEPKVQLAIDSGGANQLESLLPSGVFKAPAIDVGEIVIKNAALTYKDKGSGTSYNVKSFNAHTKALSFDTPMKATFDFVFNGQKLSGTTTLGNLTDLLSKKAAPVTLSATGSGADVKFDGTLQVPDGIIRGKAQAQAVSLETLAALLGTEMEAATVKGSLALNGDVDIAGGAINLRQAEIKLGGSNFTGDVALKTDGGFAVSNGSIRVAGIEALPDLTLTDVNIRSSTSSLTRPISLEYDFVYRGEKVDGALSASEPQALFDGAATPLKLSARANIAQVSFDGKITATPQAAQGQSAFNTASLSALTKWLDINPPGAAKFEAIKFEGQIDVAEKSYVFRKAAFEIDDMQAKGSLAIDTTKDRPEISGNLSVDKIDVAKLIGSNDASQQESVTARESSRESPGEFEILVVPVKQSLQTYIDEDPGVADLEARRRTGKSAWSKDAIDFSPLGAANADLKLDIDKLAYGGRTFGNAVLAIALNNKTLGLDITKLDAYAGSIAGRVDINAQPNTPTLKADLNFADIDIAKAALDFGAKKHMTGKAGGTSKLTSSGTSPHSIISALAGDLSAKISDGAIIGYDIRRVLRSIFSLLGGLKYSSNLKTPFDAMTADLDFKNGLARNSKIKLCGSGLRFQGEGFVNLVTQRLGYRARMIRTPRPPGVLLPLSFSGSILKPKAEFDIGGYFRTYTEKVASRSGKARQLESRHPQLDLGDPELEALVLNAMAKSKKPGTLSAQGIEILKSSPSQSGNN